jgi:hypothetical protein
MNDLCQNGFCKIRPSIFVVKKFLKKTSKKYDFDTARFSTHFKPYYVETFLIKIAYHKTK